MPELETILRGEAGRRPALLPQDAVKLVHQSEFGPGHLVADRVACQDALLREWEAVSADPGAVLLPGSERIGGGFARVPLGALRWRNQAVALGRLLFASAEAVGNVQGLEEKLRVLRALTAGGGMPFSSEALAAYLEGYRREGYPVPRHSPRYREAYHPAYRVVREDLLFLFEIAASVEWLLERHGRVLAAIDGRCGSGKSSLAARLAGLFGGEVISMDHFFLPPALRTRSRLDEPGGNIHYERFEQEVVEGLRRGGSFSHRVFDCSRMDYAGERRIEPGRVLFCEGSYSLHPRWASLWDLDIFTTCPPETQRERILRRSGPQQLARFEAEWIPMEERYFEAFGLPARCTLTLDTGRMTLNGEPIPWLPGNG